MCLAIKLALDNVPAWMDWHYLSAELNRSYQDKWCYLVSTTQFGLKQVGIEQFSSGIMSRVCVYSMNLPVSVPLLTLTQNSLSV